MAKCYFASDFHLGVPSYEASLAREKKVVQWLDEIKDDCGQLFLLGDIFDFWYEYKTVVPRNYTRLLGKLAEMNDAGVKIYFFKGNHDMWTFNYLSQEVGVEVIDEHWEGTLGNKRFYLHHGDALWKGERTYKLIRKIFRSRWGIWLFHRLHPNFGVRLAQILSRSSRKRSGAKDLMELPVEQEYQYQFANHHLQEHPTDFFIFGHRHKPMDIRLSNKSRLINLGDWVSYFTYAVFDGNELELKTYQP